ncbi:NS3 [Equine encephalosis virus]|uniref:NS3 n=1 Tax=Equine encephalosis virus TaxID=201490 RepID=C3TUR3_9REOV|nr:NS3 [Equine encephalosis virus]ACJ06243.1 NS3 [Equine encephalosis virus]
MYPVLSRTVVNNPEERALMVYPPTAPMPPVMTWNNLKIDSVDGMKDLALNILDKNITSTTGADECDKREKAMFASVAESAADSPMVRTIKVQIYNRVLDDMEREKQKCEKRRAVLKFISYTFITLMLTSTFLMAMIQTPPITQYVERACNGTEEAEKTDPCGLMRWSGAVQFLTLIMSGFLYMCKRWIATLSTNVDRISKNILKRRAYIDAARSNPDATVLTVTGGNTGDLPYQFGDTAH